MEGMEVFLKGDKFSKLLKKLNSSIVILNPTPETILETIATKRIANA